MTKPQRYPRDPVALLPLLEALLPASIALVGSIRSSPTLEIFATFPADPPAEWMVVAVLPGPVGQMRIFHSFEAGPITNEEKERGQAMVNAVVGEMLRDRPGYKLGAVHEAWSESLRLNVVGGRYHTMCTTFLAPKNAQVDASRADTCGLILDEGRPGDEVLIQAKSGYRTREWYAAQLGHTSVLRPTPDSLPVAWVVTVADGAIGALYTLPEFRRRGLAKAVLAHRLGKMTGLPGFCHVEVTNGASESLWEGMGWTRGHRVNWIYADD
ncbi:uncharacterized protein CcaverHIS019_0310190 [Cutaneotrichosporon cavernicola]|uniref:N-acetyltransferase domain-containing protein n=1 Tax=Cutaneotrichosporon cavernicola TaxID=279322 RepID=A0AA48KZV2_9TREE|nr:uncharacterized protein CcaverHIS019_0310190 [Cutaneotrichosporon cavernicola]BEI90949.1 hypothetical protein CcaverHIS019_0310190 [Cutaneotrichosporon cavernicola]BEI98728.1 hypothetical protein CcaverHIS631_0310270 [Cutaneotrichosporon cavernicola]